MLAATTPQKRGHPVASSARLHEDIVDGLQQELTDTRSDLAYQGGRHVVDEHSGERAENMQQGEDKG